MTSTCRCGVFRTVLPTLSSLILMGQFSFGSESQESANREWGQPVGGQAISIAIEKKDCITGDKVILNIAVKNMSDHDVRSRVSGPLDLFKIRVSFPDGRDVPLTMWGRREVLDAAGGSLSDRTLHPGEQISVRIMLSRLFDLSLGGKYTVMAKTKVIVDTKARKIATANSNSLQIEIDDRFKESDSINQWTFPNAKKKRS
jgi:hypothetical protein